MLMRRTSRPGLGDLYKVSTWTGNLIDCDTSLWSLFTPSCWNPGSTGVEAPDNPNIAAIQAALAPSDAPPVPTGCTSTILSSIGVCDYLVYGGIGILVFGIVMFMGGGRR
jgi:hypothetical protein